MFLISAPAKVILLGEHAVVYNKPCIAVSLDKRSFCLAKLSDSHNVLECPDIGLAFDSLHPSSGLTENADKALKAFLCLLEKTKFSGCHLTIKSEIPVGAGLGSSASYSVCLATAILLLSKKISYPLTDDHRHAINTLAFEAEKVIHGTPSGVDNTISTFGGAKIYQKGKGVLDLKGFPALSILLTDTNVPKNTKQQVELFAQRKLKYPKLMNNVIDSISNVVEEAIELFGRLDTMEIDLETLNEDLKELIQINHSLLSASGMSHTSLDTIVLKAQHFSLASKLTGAGGGGCCLTYLPHDTARSDITKLQIELLKLGSSCFETLVGGVGVTVKPVSNLFPDLGSLSFEELRKSD